MFGAILGDFVGSPYEFDRYNYKAKDFPFISEKCRFTDDSIMTLAVADGLMNAGKNADDETIRQNVVRSMRTIGRRYPNCGYGGRFARWLFGEDPKPYGSYGNGSAMRVSPAAWLYDDLETVRRVARLTAEVTHNHPEGIKGAEAVASAIFLARTEHNKRKIRRYVEKEFGYDLSRTCDEIRPEYRMDATCQGSVPQAITAFLEGRSLKNVICTAVSLGGDSDTIAAIAGSIAEGYYGFDGFVVNWLRTKMPQDLAQITYRYQELTGLYTITYEGEERGNL